MKIKHFIVGFIIITIFACNNKPQNTKHQVSNSARIDSSASLTNYPATSGQPVNNNLKGFKSNIEKETLGNSNFRKVLYTGKHLQLVLMSLKPGEEIGEEIHTGHDQFFRFESGKGKCIINGNAYDVKDGDVIVVPAGARHNVINTDASKELKMYTIYGPPDHKDGIIHVTKKEADKNDVPFDGKTTE